MLFRVGVWRQEKAPSKLLFAKAMKMPALQRLFEELSFVYGEL